MIKNKRRVLRHTIVTAALCLVMGITGFADDKGTVVTASAKIRQSADASSEQIGSVTLGGNVDIIAQTTGTDGSTWYQVYVDANTKGYIRADLVKAEGSGTISKITNTTASTTTTTTASTSTDQSETQVTAVDSKKCTVSQNSVRIRKGASTNHDIVATANRGMALTITGEATGSDGKTWYQVTFTYNNSEITGFIRSDLVTFDDVSDDAATSQITGEGAEASTEVETESETQTEETESEENSSQGIVLMNVDETPYILPGFSSVSLSWNDESIQAYSNGGFYLFYARMENGDEGWYIFDSEKGEYQRYVYTASATATVPSNTESIGIIPVIILIIIIVILAAVIGLLLIKLKDASNGYEYDDYQEDDNDTDDLEFEEIEPRRQPVPVQRQQARQPQQYQQVRRTSQQPTQGTNQSGQARQNGQVRRTQGQTGQSQSVQGQQVRRTTSQNTNGQQVRRPQGQSGQSQSVQGQQVRRTTQNPNGQQVRRTQAQRTANNNQSINASQQGYKAKTILEKQDDDMEFIDL